ncbi:MAG: glycosyltransferase [Halopseudomonas sp.]
MPPRVLFYVQHLLGIGHIKRASLLVRGWLDAGLDVTVVSGGEPFTQFGFEGAGLVQLPPVKARDSAFSGLVDAQGEAIDAEFKRRRVEQLLAALDSVQPQLLVIENYPFGRRQLRWELRPLLERAQQLSSKPRIACSVRDILQRRSPERVDETVSLIDRFFDAVLVHGDRRFIPLESSFPRCQAFANKLHYTGYVTEELPSQPLQHSSDTDEVVVSAGGGAVGFALMQTCLQALLRPELMRLLVAPSQTYRWRFLLGPNVTDQQRQQLLALAGQVDPVIAEVVVEPVRSDFSGLLQRCLVSISQGGYNTLMDLLAAGCAAVVIPFEGSGETEQLTRTERLAQLGYCQMVRESELNPESLVRAIGAIIAAPQPDQLGLDCGGAERSAQILKQLVGIDE